MSSTDKNKRLVTKTISAKRLCDKLQDPAIAYPHSATRFHNVFNPKYVVEHKHDTYYLTIVDPRSSLMWTFRLPETMKVDHGAVVLPDVTINTTPFTTFSNRIWFFQLKEKL